MNQAPVSEITLKDCWNQIGVAGDRSCDLLLQHVHCRNCDVYAGAARDSLQRPVAPGYREDWARQLRQPPEAEMVRDRSGLVFRIGAEWLMLPTGMVDSVAPSARPHTLPHRASGALAGIVNVGGTLLPAVALERLLGIDGHAITQAQQRHVFARLAVLRVEGQRFAVPVADLHGIVRYGEAKLQAPAATINKGLQRYLAGVLAHQDMMIGALDGQLIGHQLTQLLR